MKNCTSLLFLSIFQSVIAQDLLLVIDEQFANKTFDSFNDLLYQQIPGDLHYKFDHGEVGENGFGYRDTLADFDGTGIKKWHYQYTQDSLIFFPRRDNIYTTSQGITFEANGHGAHGGVETISGGTLIYPWTFKQGFFEVKAKLPEGTGIMSTWFFFGTRNLIGYGCEPGDNGLDINWQEVDVWETNGNWPTRLRNNIHFSGFLPDPTYQCDNNGEVVCNEKCAGSFEGANGMTEIDFTSDFHTIGMYWDQWFVILFIDGYVYRYWTKPEPINKGNGYPDPLLFLDAMLMYIGTGYGTQFDTIISGFPRVDEESPTSALKDQYSFGDNLYGPDPRLSIPSSKLEMEYFRYWVFVPCEDQDSLTTLLSNSYYNQKNVSNYNTVNYGHFETGQSIICSDSYIGPTVNPINPTEEFPYTYSDQLNLVASKSIHLHTGFHAKAATSNYPIDSQFHGKIQTCSSIPVDQPLPLLQHYNSDYYPSSFWGDFQFSLSTMIDESWDNDGPLKNAEINDGTGKIISEKIIYTNSETQQPEEFIYQIYPNPFDEDLFINAEFTEGAGAKFELRNSIGELVQSGIIIGGSNKIPLYQLAEGIYFLTIVSNNQENSYKIINQ